MEDKGGGKVVGIVWVGRRREVESYKRGDRVEQRNDNVREGGREGG